MASSSGWAMRRIMRLFRKLGGRGTEDVIMDEVVNHTAMRMRGVSSP